MLLYKFEYAGDEHFGEAVVIARSHDDAKRATMAKLKQMGQEAISEDWKMTDYLSLRGSTHIDADLVFHIGVRPYTD